MLAILLWSVALLALPVFVATAVIVAEIFAAVLPARRSRVAAGARPRCAVLVPAHDEEGGIGRTLAAIRPQLVDSDRILVVADNCTDGTAAVAASAGAEVVERTDPVRRGKGYALDFGARTLKADPPDVVVIVDADCVMEPGSLDRLVRTAAATGRPAQAAYVMDAPADGGTRARVAAFLFALKNVIRPRGLARLGLPCLLTGSGMAFPWELLRAASLASGNLVEDMQLGIDLALAGRAPVFCPDAMVRSELPAGHVAATSQRTRWIHGHLRTLVTQAPQLLAAALLRRRPDLLAFAMELSVPPLSLLVLGGALALATLSAGWLFGGPGLPAAAATAVGTAGLAALFVAWLCYGGEYLSAADLAAVPFELAGRMAVLLRFFVRPQATWVRTARRSTQ
jgi:cellulose synthase/poly-beta-1,6-N-acetylglucosamine synthase-like glycosyltransferase